MEIKQKILEIKRDFRTMMNGVASFQMRQRGLEYHINFGIELPRLMEYSKSLTLDRALALALWNENVRESKILACVLLPNDEVFDDICEIWVEQIPNIEIARIAFMYLFMRHPSVAEKAFNWIARDSQWCQVCGYLMLAKLLQQGCEFSSRGINEIKDQAQSVLASDNIWIVQAANMILNRLNVRTTD